MRHRAKTERGADFWQINPKGYVPVLELDDGRRLTENPAILQYLGDQHAQAGLVPPCGSPERYSVLEWLNFIATELHKGFGPINHPKSGPELKQVYRQRLDARFGVLAKALAGREFLAEEFSVADIYAYYTLRQLRRLDASAVDGSAVLKPYYERIAARPAVRAALEAEGVS